MKIETLISNTWDDLVFENKNKEYGAYLVRKSYSQNMTTGLGLSVAMACALFLLTPMLNLLSGGKSIIPISKQPEDLTIIFEPPLVIPLPKPPAPPPSQTQSVHANLTPAVTTRQVETEIPTNDEITASMIETGTSDGVPTTISGEDISSLPVAEESTIRDFAEVMPQYDGGLKEMMKFIQRKINYPLRSARIGTEGTVYVAFIIDKDGKVTDVNVVKGISADCDKEAVRVISLMKAWIPGMQNHRTVSVRMTLPIKFQLKPQ